MHLHFGGGEAEIANPICGPHPESGARRGDSKQHGRTTTATCRPSTILPRISTPNSATPMAAPACRIAFSKPDAEPDRERGTVASRAAVIGGTAKQIPNRMNSCAGSIDA
jgi:hypothetical protein